MTEKQKRFCDEYLIDLNAAQAAIRAGYSKKAAKQVGSENLTKPDLKKYIKDLGKKAVQSAQEAQKHLTVSYHV